MVKKVNHDELKDLIKVYYKSKKSLMVYGTFGIGKSESVRDTARALSEEREREFIEWNRINHEKRIEVFNNPEKYFVILDVRLSEFDASDIKGLPNFETKIGEWIEWKVPFFAKLLEKPESDGILFFDEINLATPLVISACYKIIYDRIINEGKISDNWLIMGCGNLSEDRAYTHDLVPTIRDRGGEVELQFDSDKWVFDWATQNGIDSRIIGFISFKKSALHNVDFEDNQKFTTPRGWARLNDLIKGITDFKQIELISCSAIGEGIAREFTAFCRLQKDINLSEILNNPSLIKNISDISLKYFITTAIAEKYKDKKTEFKQIVGISEALDEIDNAEFVSLLWRLCFKYNKKKFLKDFTDNDKDIKKLADKYGKYLT